MQYKNINIVKLNQYTLSDKMEIKIKLWKEINKVTRRKVCNSKLMKDIAKIKIRQIKSIF